MLGDDHGYPCPHFLLSGGGAAPPAYLGRKNVACCTCMQMCNV